MSCCVVMLVCAAGLWLQEVLSNMQAKKNGTFMNEKLFLYSGVSWVCDGVCVCVCV